MTSKKFDCVVYPEWSTGQTIDCYEVQCKICGTIQFPSTIINDSVCANGLHSAEYMDRYDAEYAACLKCCKHGFLQLKEVWRCDCVGRELEAECRECGKDDFARDELLSDYELVKKSKINI